MSAVTLPLLISAYFLGYGLTEGILYRAGPGSEIPAVWLAAVWPLTVAASILAVLSLPVAIATGSLDLDGQQEGDHP
jgi:hypothetical protein